jgi:hypothetical protein
MPREIITTGYGAMNNAPVGAAVDGYKERLLKYIPAEVITLYMALRSVVETAVGVKSVRAAAWVIFVAGVVSTIVQLRQSMTIPNYKQIAISTLAFVIWALAIGGQPFIQVFDEKALALWAGIALPIFTFAVARYEP